MRAAFAICVGVVTALGAACDGKVLAFPIIDPDGNVIAADGATYGPSMCDGYDASRWTAPTPSCMDDAGVKTNLACVAWGTKSYPRFGWGECSPTESDAGLVDFCSRGFASANATCDDTAEGDAYCRALMQPLVRSFPVACECQQHFMGGPPAHWTACGWASGCNCYGNGEICVTLPDGGLGCVPPCE